LTEDLLGQANPDANARDKKVTVEELLHRAADKIDGNTKFAGRPGVEASLRLTLGKTFYKLSDLSKAEKHLRRALDLWHEAAGTQDPRTLVAEEALADFLYRGLGQFAEGMRSAHQNWQARARVLGPEHGDTLESLHVYAMALASSGRVDEAIPLIRECLAAQRRVLGATHNHTLISMNNRAHALVKRGEWSEAKALLSEALDARGKLGPVTELVPNTTNLAQCLHAEGDLEAADRLLRELLDRVIQALGPDHQETDRVQWIQIKIWIDQGYLERAVTLGREAIVRRRRIYPDGHHQIGNALMDLGRGLVLLGRCAEGETILAESMAIFAKVSPSLPHYPVWAEFWYGTSLMGQRRYVEAEPHLLAREKGLREARSTPRRHYRQAVEQLVKFYTAWGKADEATRWRREPTAFDDSRWPSGANGAKTSARGR
jgi:tetratricopeptide (TPR) repeat protein